jgi:DNA polymerase-3 subunit alpha
MRPPCVNGSEAEFAVAEGAILYGLGALKNVGVEAMRLVTAARGGRPFASLADFARRVDLRRLGKRALETLAHAGAFDMLEPNRARVAAAIDAFVAWSGTVHDSAQSGQASLFGSSGADLPEPRLPAVVDLAPPERLAAEHAAVGFYLSGHPLDDEMAALARAGVLTQAEAARRAASAPTVARIAGTVASVQDRRSARGNRFAFVQLSDPTGLYEVTIFSDTLDAARGLLEPGAHLVFGVEATAEGETVKFLARSVATVASVVATAAPAGLRVRLGVAEAAAELARIIAQARAQPGPRGPVIVAVPDPLRGNEIDIRLPGSYPVGGGLRGALRAAPGVLSVEEV